MVILFCFLLLMCEIMYFCDLSNVNLNVELTNMDLKFGSADPKFAGSLNIYFVPGPQRRVKMFMRVTFGRVQVSVSMC